MEKPRGNDSAKKGILKTTCGVDSKQDGRTKKAVSFYESKSTAYGQTMHHSFTSQADPQSLGFVPLGLVNTREDFLFNSEYQKEQTGNYNLVKAVVQSGLDDPNDSATAELMTSNTPPYHLMKDPGRQSHPSISAGREQNELRNATQKISGKSQSDVTLLVGDSMLRNVKPEKFFKTKNVVVKTVKEMRVNNISEFVTGFVREENPSRVILHVGTNDLHEDILHIARHIESVGKLITETFPRVTKFAISSIIQRRDDIAGVDCAKVSEVNKTLKNIQLKQGWDYIDNENLDPEVHLGQDGIHLNVSGTRAYAANISNYLALVECGLQHKTSNPTFVSNDQLPVHVTAKNTGNSATSCRPTENSGEIFISSEKNAPDKKPITLLAGDSLLESVELGDYAGNKLVSCVVVPFARVDIFSNMIICFAKRLKVGEVILSIGSNDLNDKVFTPTEIAWRIEQIGMDLKKTFPSISKITICGLISRNRRDAYDVNALLKEKQSKHGWGYICNDNVYPEFHNDRPLDVELKGSSAKIFEENVIRYLLPQHITGTRSTDIQVPITQQGNSRSGQKSSSELGTSCEEDVADTAKISRHTNQQVVLKDQPLAVPEPAIEDTFGTAASLSKISPEASISGKRSIESEKVTLLIGDSLLESVDPLEISRTKKIKLVVDPDASVDNIGETISKHVKNPSVDQVILHVGSKDIKDDIYTQMEIATKIKAIGMTLETSCPHIKNFTMSGVIETFEYERVKSRNLNTLLKSSTFDHSWAYICNDNIHPASHMEPFQTKLNSCGTRLLTSNIIGHLRYMKSERFRSASQASGMQGNNDQSSCKYARPEFVVPGKANKVPLEDPQADKRPPKDLKADKLPQKDLSRKKSCEDGLGRNAGMENEPRDGQTGCSARGRGQSQTRDETHLIPSRRRKPKRRKKEREHPFTTPHFSPRMRSDESRERPNSKSQPHRENRDGNHPRHNYKYSSACYSRSATRGPTRVRPQPTWGVANAEGHKKADCPRRI